jgi:hypothetical protein
MTAIGSATSHAAQYAKPTLKRMTQNIGTHLRNSAYNLAQDPASIRGNVIIYSAFLLVSARSITAWLVALQSRGTDQAKYRQEQAINTTFRQMVGWVASYLLLRSIQGVIRKGYLKQYGIETLKKDNLFPKIGQEIRTFFKKEPQSLQPLIREPYHGPAAASRFIPEKEAERVALFKKNESWMNRFADWTPDLKNPTMNDKIKNYIEWMSLLKSSVPTVLVSGVALELFNQNLSTVIFEKIANAIQPKDKKIPVAGVTPTAPSQNVGETASKPAVTEPRPVNAETPSLAPQAVMPPPAQAPLAQPVPVSTIPQSPWVLNQPVPSQATINGWPVIMAPPVVVQLPQQ